MRSHSGVIAAADPLLQALQAAGLYGYIPAAGKLWQERDGSRATPAAADGDLIGEIAEYTGTGPSALAASDAARGVLRVRGGLRWLEVDGANGGYTLGNAVLTDAMTTASYFAAIRVSSIAPARQWVIARFKNQGDWHLNNWGGFGVAEYQLYAEIPGATGTRAFTGNNRTVEDLLLDEIHNGDGSFAGSINGTALGNSGAQGTPNTGSPATLLFRRDHTFGSDPFAGDFYGLAIGTFVAAGTLRDDVRTQMGVLAGLHMAYLDFATSSVSGLVADYDMQTDQYSDAAATTLQSTDNGVVRALKSESITAVTATTDLTRVSDSNVRSLRTSDSTSLFTASGVNIDRRDFSVHFALRPLVAGHPSKTGLLGLGAGSNLELNASGQPTVNGGGSSATGATHLPPENTVLSIVGDGSGIQIRYNKAAAETLAPNFSSGSSTVLDLLGASDLASFLRRGTVFRIVICSPRATATELAKIEELLLRKYPAAQLSLTKTAVVIHGNSITSAITVPEMETRLGSGYDVAIRAFPGQTTPQMTAAAAADVDPYYDATRTQGNVLVSWEITNDIRVNSVSGATAYANVQTYRAAREAVWGAAKVITLDCLPATDLTGAKETARLAVNASLAAEYSTATANSRVWRKSGGGLLLKISEHPNLGDPTNATYYADGLHLTTAGQDLVEIDIAAAVALV